MTADDFTEAARTEAEDYARTPRMNVGTVRDRIAEAHLAGAAWGREQALAQEPTDAEVEAAAEAWEAHTPAEFHEDEGEMCCRECGEAFDWVPLDAARFDARRRAHRFRAALSAARAARRDEGTR